MKVLKFSADWCKPCQALKQIIEETDLGDVEFQDINVDYDFDVVSKYAVRGFPTLVMVDEDGTEIKRHIGLISASDLKEWVA